MNTIDAIMVLRDLAAKSQESVEVIVDKDEVQFSLGPLQVSAPRGDITSLGIQGRMVFGTEHMAVAGDLAAVIALTEALGGHASVWLLP